MNAMANTPLDMVPPGIISVAQPACSLNERDGGCVAEPILLWHVAEVEPRQQHLARQSLLAAGFQVIAPLVREAVRLPKGQRGTTTRPMWPGYLLMGRLAEQDWSAAYRCRGVGGLLHAAGNAYSPSLVPDRLVHWLLTNMSAAGVIEAVSVPELLPALDRNAPLRVLRGPFAGQDGVCLWSSMERVTLLLSVMGGQRRVTVRRDQVEAV